MVLQYFSWVVSLGFEVIKYFRDRDSILIKCSDWNLWINKVTTRDKRIVFAVTVKEVIYDRDTNEFSYKKLKEYPIWLSETQLQKLIGVLTDLSK